MLGMNLSLLLMRLLKIIEFLQDAFKLFINEYGHNDEYYFKVTLPIKISYTISIERGEKIDRSNNR